MRHPRSLVPCFHISNIVTYWFSFHDSILIRSSHMSLWNRRKTLQDQNNAVSSDGHETSKPETETRRL